MAVRRHVLGSSAEWGDQGYIYREVMHVTGISAANVAEAEYAAMLEIPQRLDTLTLGADEDEITLYLTARTVQRVAQEPGTTTAQVNIEGMWKQFVAPTIELVENADDDGDGVATVGSVVETVETEFDSAGAEITVKRDSSSPARIQPVQFRRPRPVIEFSRWEESSPRSRADTYVGKVNLTTWNGYSAGTVLCAGIVGTTRDGGDTYDVRYDFEVNPNGWDVTVVYIDEDTGRPISGLVTDVSKKTVSLYTQVSFIGLNITL